MLMIGTAALFVAAPAAAADDPICADRPGKGTGTCTVPAGMWQIETGLIDWTLDRSDGVRSDSVSLGQSLIRYGISDRSDIELGVAPFQSERTRDPFGVNTVSGFGDLVVRVKYALTSSDAPVQVALDPFVSLPTAGHGLGSGKVEAGLTVPINFTLGKGPFSLALSPELDWRADGDGGGHHAGMTEVIGLGWAATPRLGLGAELWRDWDWDPAGTGRQTGVEGSVTYLVSNNVQIDGGVDAGLNDATPEVEVYAGVSTRF